MKTATFARRIFAAYYLFMLLSVCAASLEAQTLPADPQKVHLFLCIGRSNMAGRGEIGEQDKILHDRVFLFNKNDAFEQAENPLNRYSTIRKATLGALGMSWTFSHAIADHNPGIAVGLIVNARGGSKTPEWKVGGALFEESLARAKRALKYGVYKGVIYQMGESSPEYTNVDAFTKQNKAMMEKIRKELGSDKIAFVMGEIPASMPGAAKYNAGLAKMPSIIPLSAPSSKDGITLKGDNKHFNAAGQRASGKNYAKAMIGLIYDGPVSAVITKSLRPVAIPKSAKQTYASPVFFNCLGRQLDDRVVRRNVIANASAIKHDFSK